MKVKLKEIAKYEKGKQLNGDLLLPDGQYEYLNGGVKPSGRWSDFNTPGQTITISEGGNSSGYVGYMENPFWCGAHCYYLYETKVDGKYLYYALKSQQERIMSLRSGACMPNIKKKDLGELLFTIDLEEERQKRIVSIFERIDYMIGLRKSQLTKLDELVKARFVELFGHPDKNEKGWKMNTFGDICTVRQGLQIPISKRLTEYEEGCYEYITVQYLHGGKKREYIKNPKDTVICNKDDILMTRTGNTGMVITGVDGVFHNNFFLIDFDRKKYDKDFLVQYLNLDMIQADILRRAGTSTIPDLNHGEFYKIQVFEPPMSLQEEFNDVLQQVDKSKDAVQRGLDKLETLKKALMQEYFG